MRAMGSVAVRPRSSSRIIAVQCRIWAAIAPAHGPRSSLLKYQGYAMYKGKVPGLYDEWHECEAQVTGFKGASHKGFKSREEAEASYLRFTLA